MACLICTLWISFEANGSAQTWIAPGISHAGMDVVGVILVIAAAYAARSVALAGFGLDSLIEIFASIVVVWQLTGVNLNRERLALRLIGMALI